jgi:hypothetical protein
MVRPVVAKALHLTTGSSGIDFAYQLCGFACAALSELLALWLKACALGLLATSIHLVAFSYQSVKLDKAFFGLISPHLAPGWR